MRLEQLRIIHLKKGSSPVGEGLLKGAFVIDSCLRRLWICDEQLIREQGIPQELEPAEVLGGQDAYSFLLRVACGLESQIAGETDIFGQVKEAWKQARKSILPEILEGLSPWMQRLFEDTKEIRSLYLQNMGGASYGSLVRMILSKQPMQTRGPVLLVGAGQLAKSVAPYLLETELWLTNRSRAPLVQLHHDLLQKTCAQSKVRVLEDEKSIQIAWLKAAQVVLCVPPSTEADTDRIALWKRGGEMRPVVHLGALREQAGEWATLPGFYSLTDVFALETSQGELRLAQISRARRACDEKSKLRLLGGGSVSLPHGWEDLAVFA